MKNTITLLFSLIFWLGVYLPLQASNVQGAEEIIITEPTQGNQYLAGGKVKIRAPIAGDLIAIGGELWVQDSIRDDAALAGGNIVINGFLGGDLRLMGGSITIKSDVYGDLVITGGEIKIEKGVIIYGDLIVAGGEVYCGGTINGTARIGAGELQLDGAIRQEARIRAGQVSINSTLAGPVTMVAEKISLSSDAHFNDAVNYWTPGGEIDFSDHLSPGVTPEFNPDLKGKRSEFNWRHLGLGLVGITIYRLFAGGLLIVLLVSLFSRFFSRQAGQMGKNWPSRLGYGLLLFLGLPVAAVIAMATVIGLPAGLLMFSVWGIALMLGHVLTATVLTYELEKSSREEWRNGRIILIAISVFLAMKVIGFIPVIGWLVNIALMLVAFGQVIYSLWNQEKPDTGMNSDMV